ncbi:MAG: DUF6316 family protein [Methylococcaceae bacterium]|nr:DUF6316 family protein [Methylococcaceae bacterium]MCI0733818.1 DUF6316 family protein [Methylococcaceae bacterium]
MNRRLDDPDDVHYDRTFVKDRFFVTREGWYYESRMVTPYGPFISREQAEENCRLRFSGGLGMGWKLE